MANQKIYPRNLLILDRPYLAGFRNEHCEYQASIGHLVVVEIVDFDGENVTRLLTTVESSKLQFLRPMMVLCITFTTLRILGRIFKKAQKNV
jgi:hypothetical protein